MLALFNFISQRKGAAVEYRQQMIEFREDTISVRRRLARAQRLFREDLRRDRPDPARVLLDAVGPGQQLWMRRRADPDYLELRLGVADRPSPIKVSDRSRKETDEPPEPDTLGDVPVSLSMRDLGVIGICGEGGGVDALARWLVGQAAVLHAPGDLDVVVLTNAEREQQWGWTRWLPHCRRPGEPVAAVLGTEQQSVSRRLAELSQLIADRSPDDRRVGLPGDITPRPDVLVVVDGARRLRALPGLVTLLREGPAVGVTVICLDEDVRLLPEECRAVLDVHEGLVELRRTGSEAVARIRPDLVEASWAARIGRALAPVRDTTPTVEVSGLPSSARLLECISLEHPTPEGVARRWGPEARTDVVIGEGFDGPFRLDIRKDGPHALIAGTTGSGKSELLQTLVASLAVANRPEQLTFVLVDYKGGSAFKDCARLPHTVGMVTDLDTHLVSRALTSLGAELKRREHLLAVPGAKDLEDYWALQRRDPTLPTIPRLVIVIDEFASLEGRAARLRDRPGDHRPARPVARHPPGARHPAALRRDLQRHPGQHQPADRAAGHRRRRVQGRHRRRRVRDDRSRPAGSRLRPARPLVAAAVPGRSGRRCPAGRHAGRGHRARATDRLAGRLGGRRASGAGPAEGGGQADRRGRDRPVRAGRGDRRRDRAAGDRHPALARGCRSCPRRSRWPRCATWSTPSPTPTG